MKKFIQIAFVLCAVFFFSCKAKKNLPRKPERCHLGFKTSRALTGHLKENQAKFSTFSGKIKVSATIDDKTTDFNVSLRMLKDSIIWASISVMGIEGVRFYATNDSIKFFIRKGIGGEGKYYIGGYDTLSKILKTEIDLDILQSLLVGNNAEFYDEDEKLRPGIDSCQYILGTIRKRKLNRKIRKGKGLEPAQTIWMQDSTYKITRILFREFGTGREFDARFSDFRNVDLPEGVTQQITVPFVLTYSIKAEKNYTISLEYSKASANKPQTFPFTIPEGYERIK